MSKMTVEKIEALNASYLVPPVCQGQTVEVAYGADWEERIVVRRTHDRSDGRVSYAYASAEELADEEQWEPWDHPPQLREGAEWREVAE
jgi:hypothetical protein